MSAAAGLLYSGPRFEHEFADYIARYGFRDLYSSSFYEFATEEERWTRWARHIDFIRYRPGAMPLYRKLLELVRKKEYFVITTNVDAQFRKTGFDQHRLFEVQGDYGQMQCAVACHDTLYDNRPTVEAINANAENLTVDSRFVPRCPVCGGRMDVHVRINRHFVEDRRWHDMMECYSSFVERYGYSRLVLLELGVGFNTPSIIRLPFERMTRANSEATLVRLNADFPQASSDICCRTVSFREEMDNVFTALTSAT